MGTSISSWVNEMSRQGYSAQIMPALFIGHGSPMNAIEDNDFTRSLHSIGKIIPKPKAILCISAHWLTEGTLVNISPKPRMIYDMYGFPDELYRVNYPAPGSPETAEETKSMVSTVDVKEDLQWGLDHGCWSVMRHVFPNADIPVFEMSIDYYKPMQYHYDLAKQLQKLRQKSVLIVGSGNITHNLRMVDMSDINLNPTDWALEFDTAVKKYIDNGNHQELIDYKNLGRASNLSVPEPSHYIPLIYTMALQNNNEAISYFYEGFHYGSLSMRCLKIG